MGSTKRTTLQLSDERQRLLDEAKEIIVDGQYDDPPNSDVIDATLTHLIESRENLDAERSELDPTTIQQFNTSVIELRYQTSIESRWRWQNICNCRDRGQPSMTVVALFNL